MSLIINIDTATEMAHVSLAKDGILLQSFKNNNQKDHAAFLQPAIRELLRHNSVKAESVDAVAVVNGPGSYTGLRVAMASAKGLCYALGKPLITVNTLELMAVAAAENVKKNPHNANILLCPMIDARRMEVFTAIFSTAIKVEMEACAMILDEHSFAGFLDKRQLLFFGNGAGKWIEICKHPNALHQNIFVDPSTLAAISDERFIKSQFTSLAYSEPFYIKPFYSAQKGQ